MKPFEDLRERVFQALDTERQGINTSDTHWRKHESPVCFTGVEEEETDLQGLGEVFFQELNKWVRMEFASGLFFLVFWNCN